MIILAQELVVPAVGLFPFNLSPGWTSGPHLPPHPIPSQLRRDGTKVHIGCQASVSWPQLTGLPIHTAQHRDLVAGVTVNVSWGDTSWGDRVR